MNRPNRQTQSNRPTAQQQVLAAQLAELGRMLTELGEQLERDAVAGNANWETVGTLTHLRQRAIELVAMPRFTANGDGIDVYADVLAEADARARSR